MVNFHGWQLPIQFRGIVEEHLAVRRKAGLFDLCHMGRVRVRGKGRRDYLQRLLTIDVTKAAPGRCRYTFFLNERGGVIDDLLFYAGEEEDLLVVNAANRLKDLAWLERHLSGDVSIEDETERMTLLAVQGPESTRILREVLGLEVSDLRYYTAAVRDGLYLSRTGYTGENGFEIFAPPDRAVSAWERLLEAGVPPVGLGARDTLRTEAGMPLHGGELDETTTPLEAGLHFAVELDKPDFIGQAALKASGPPTRKLVGLLLESRRIARHGYGVSRGGQRVGAVTSGTWSPTLERSIAMAYVPADAAEPGTDLEVDIRGKGQPAQVTKLPFYRRKKS